LVVGIGAWLSNPKEAVSDILEWMPLQDVYDAFRIKTAGEGSAFYGPGSGSTADGGFVLYPNKPNTNAISSVYSK
jgi:hypothetical protein